MQHPLDSIFKAQSIAVVGASDEKGSVGLSLIRNIVRGGFQGAIYPVNPNHRTIHGMRSYAGVKDIPGPVDMAIIATKPPTVRQILTDCGEKGVRGVVIVSAGFSEMGDEGRQLSNALLQVARAYDMRLIGPNCLGFISPRSHLNASFASRMALNGRIAFISQSGALCTAILDWAEEKNVGFSHFVSIGSMIDVGFHDLIDYFGNDPGTGSILIYMESLSHARKFMSAARAFARSKPIIVLKAGKSSEGAKAALSHTGTLAGDDSVFDAAFKRAGIVRVDTIAQLFDLAQVLAMQEHTTGARLGIVTNAGGPGVLATDRLMSRGGQLAQLSGDMLHKLNEVLPAAWSKGNPVDILGDARVERYKKALELCARDEGIDALLVIFTPQDIVPPEDVAKAVVDFGKTSEKTILACWMGEVDVKKARDILEEGSIPVYNTPENAVDSFMMLYTYTRNIRLLYETPASVPSGFTPDVEAARDLIKEVYSERRHTMTEYEAKRLLAHYGIPVSDNNLATSAAEAETLAVEIGFPVVAKIVSPDILHKTDIGGVRLNLTSGAEVREAYDDILKKVQASKPEARIDGVLIEGMQKRRYELLIGAKKDPIFGPVIVFGMGGVAVEVFKDINVGLPPLNMALAQRLIEETTIYKLLKGYRGIPPVDLHAIQFLLYKFAYLVMDFPEIREIDINPFAVDEDGGAVLDAKVVLEPSPQTDMQPYGHLVICPYPREYVTSATMKNGQSVILRPIRPEDETMEAEMFTRLSEKTAYFRFFHVLKQVTHETLVRFTHNDYDREIAIIAEVEEEDRKMMAGVVRLVADAYNETAEFAIVIADHWQGRGLGNLMTDYILEIARKRGIRTVYATLLKENEVMHHMFRKRGFSIRVEDGTTTYYAELELSR